MYLSIYLFFLSCSLFSLCLSCLLAVLLPTLSSFFCMELWLANFLGKGQIESLKSSSGFFPKMIPFLVSVTLTGLVRISKKRYCWKDLSLKKLLFINLYPTSRGPSILLDKRQNRNNNWASNESSFETGKPSLEFRETRFFYSHHLKGYREMIYFLRNITMTIHTYSECTH